MFHFRHRYLTVYSQCFFQYSSAVFYSGTTDDRCFVPSGLVSPMRSFLSVAVFSGPLTPMFAWSPLFSFSVFLPADMVKINGSSILWMVWCLLMKSYLLWVIHLISCLDNGWQRDHLTNIILDLSLKKHTHTQTHFYGHVHLCKDKCVM